MDMPIEISEHELLNRKVRLFKPGHIVQSWNPCDDPRWRHHRACRFTCVYDTRLHASRTNAEH